LNPFPSPVYLNQKEILVLYIYIDVTGRALNLSLPNIVLEKALACSADPMWKPTLRACRGPP
jgi:hypothetical protein